ncbi:MAG TPA: hypothetical protein VEH27_04370 [Methylomirabilota bacterium]|nr:hypothetical protein [Methylomirabilota bacterium]
MRGWLALAAALLCGSLAYGQALSGGKLKNYQAPSMDGGKRAKVTGREAEPVGNGLYRLTEARVETFNTNGQSDMVIEAPLAFYNQNTRMAFSPGALKAVTHAGKLTISGVGFEWGQSGSDLILSNDVRAVVSQELLSTNFLSRAQSTGTNSPLVITSRSLRATRARADFLGDATARLSDGSIRAEQSMAVHFVGKTLQVQKLECVQNVVIERTGLRMSGDRADYVVGEGEEIIHVQGQAQWQHGLRSGRADFIEYKPSAAEVMAIGGSHLEAPLFRGAQTNTAAARERPLVVVDANFFRLQMERPGLAGEKLEASTNVVIRIPSEATIARTRAAYYDEAEGVLRMMGDPIWITPEWELAGQQIVVNEKAQTVHAMPNGRLKVAASAFGLDQFFRSSAATNAVQGPWFVQTTSQSIFYTPERMQFQTNVHVRVLEGDAERGWSKSQALIVHFRPDPQPRQNTNALPSLKSSSVDRVVAIGGVTAEQFPWPRENGDMISKKMRAEEIAFAFQPGADAAVDTITVWENARLEQTAVSPRSSQPSTVALEANYIHAKFFPLTNRVDTIVATTNVVIQHNRGVGRGQKAIYTGTNDVVELSGNPVASVDSVNVPRAETMFWRRSRGTFGTVGGVRAEWTRVTNNPALLKK